MYENFKRFEKLQFANRCLSCSKPLEAGQPAYGSNRHGPTGKWVFVCPDCYARDMKTSAPVVEEREEEATIDPAVLELIEEHAREERERATTTKRSNEAPRPISFQDMAGGSTTTRAATLRDEETKRARPFLEVIREQARWRLASS